MKKTVKETLRVPTVPRDVPTKEVLFKTSGSAQISAERSGDEDFYISMVFGGGSTAPGWYFDLVSIKEFQQFLHELEDELVAFPNAVTDDTAARGGS